MLDNAGMLHNGERKSGATAAEVTGSAQLGILPSLRERLLSFSDCGRTVAVLKEEFGANKKSFSCLKSRVFV